MGANLVQYALTTVCPRLGRNHASRVALIVMCNTALDRAAVPEYFAGWRPIALALGLAGSERSQHERVRKILAELVEADAIELAEAPAPRRPAKYELKVRPLRLVHDADRAVDNDGGITGDVWS